MPRTVDAFRRFPRLTEDFGVDRLRSAATSARREAGNGPLLARLIHEGLASALHLGRKYQFDEEHAVLTSKLAAQLFFAINLPA